MGKVYYSITQLFLPSLLYFQESGRESLLLWFYSAADSKAADKSRRERRKEARIEKNKKKFGSWIQHHVYEAFPF